MMSKFEITRSDGKVFTAEAETMHRDGDWIMLTKQTQLMEDRQIDDPDNPNGKRVIQVATGRVGQQPVAYFHKPLSVRLLKEPADGNDA